MWHYRAALVRVIDGDSLVIDLDLGFFVMLRQAVRLVGIDAPELTAKDVATRSLAMQAKNRLISLLPPEFECRTYKADARDKYGRWLVDIMLDGGATASEVLIAEGLGVPYQGGARA